MKSKLFLTSALALVALTTTTSCQQNLGAKYTPGTPLKVGLICLHDETSTYDKNFITAFKAAFKNAQDKGYISKDEKVENSIKTGIPEGNECFKACQEFVNQKYNLIFTDSFGHDEFVHDAAKKFKNVQFSSATGIEARKSGLNNYHNAFASIYEGRFLAGVSAGYYLQEQKNKKDGDDVHLAYVGAFPYAEVISGFTSWYLGVKHVFPNSNVDMRVTYTNTWYGQAEEEEAAERLIALGNIDCMSQHADSYGAPKACEKAGIPNVSYNISLEDTEYSSVYAGYSKINWQPYYDNAIKSMFDGKTEFEDERENNWTGSLATNSVIYQPSSKLSSEAKGKIDDVAKKLQNHEMYVFDTNTFTVKQLKDKYEKGAAPEEGKDYTLADSEGHLKTMMGATDMYDRDQNLVATDTDHNITYINESYYRSAPSFDFIIDGILKAI